jgi:serine phosphatase RsbU (regulator of sigma subunit)
MGLVAGLARKEPNKNELAPGDILALITDGIFEYENPLHQPFGQDRVADLIHTHQDEPMAQLLERIVLEVERFADLAPQKDDMTMLLVRRLPA